MDTEGTPVYGGCMLEKDYAGLVRVFPLDPSNGKWEVFVLSVLDHMWDHRERDGKW